MSSEKRGRYANLTCEERQIEKNRLLCQQAAYAQRITFLYRKRRNGGILDTGLSTSDFKDRIVGWYDAIGHEAYPVDQTDMEHRKEEINVAFLQRCAILSITDAYKV